MDALEIVKSKVLKFSWSRTPRQAAAVLQRVRTRRSHRRGHTLRASPVKTTKTGNFASKQGKIARHRGKLPRPKRTSLEIGEAIFVQIGSVLQKCCNQNRRDAIVNQ
jgi:hypothetical protein